MAALMALRHSSTPATEKALIEIAKNEGYAEEVRAQCIFQLLTMPGDHCDDIAGLIKNDGVVSYAALKYCCKCEHRGTVEKKLKVIRSNFFNEVWTKCTNAHSNQENTMQDWIKAVNQHGNPQLGSLFGHFHLNVRLAIKLKDGEASLDQTLPMWAVVNPSHY